MPQGLSNLTNVHTYLGTAMTDSGNLAYYKSQHPTQMVGCPHRPRKLRGPLLNEVCLVFLY
jgi:hypothetical protein